MSDILDDELISEEKTSKAEITSNKNRKAAIYIGIMMFGGMIFHYFTIPRWGFLTMIVDAISIITIPFLISIVVETIRYLLHIREEKKKGHKIDRDPFWFQLIENTFAIWILTGIVFVPLYVLGLF